MPTYDYQCRSCGQTTEVIHAMTEEGPTTCEACGGPLRRVLYPAGIIFKGSGFYKTDSRRSSTAATASTSGSSTSSTSAAGSGESGAAKPSSATSTETTSAGTSSPAAPADGAKG